MPSDRATEKAHTHTSGPAYGKWSFEPTEFQTGFVKNILSAVKIVGFAVGGLLVLAALLQLVGSAWSGFSPNVLIFRPWWGYSVSGVILIFLTWYLTNKPILARTKGKFNVVVELNSDDDRSDVRGYIKMKDRWGGNWSMSPDGDDDHPINSFGEAAALQNVLPRLCDLQRSAKGGPGMLEVAEIDSADGGGWKFRCRHYPPARLWLRVKFGLFSGLSLGLLGFLIINYVSGTASMFVLFGGFVLAFGSGIGAYIAGRAMTLTDRLFLEITKRPIAGNVVELHWVELCNYSVTHRHWAVLGNAQGVTKFCEKVTQLQDVVKYGDIDHGEIDATDADLSSQTSFIGRTSPRIRAKRREDDELGWSIHHVEA